MTFKEAKKEAKKRIKEERNKERLANKVYRKVCKKIKCVGCPVIENCHSSSLRVGGGSALTLEKLNFVKEWYEEKTE